MRITRASVERSCAICERTLLMGERATRYSPNGGEHYVDVCPLCQELADVSELITRLRAGEQPGQPEPQSV